MPYFQLAVVRTFHQGEVCCYSQNLPFRPLHRQGCEDLALSCTIPACVQKKVICYSYNSMGSKITYQFEQYCAALYKTPASLFH